MKSFYELSCIIEDYKSLDRNAELGKIGKINMTANLPMPKGGDVLQQIRELTRGFHLNTIIGRMFQPWAVGLELAPTRWDLQEKGGEKEVYKWRISRDDKRANNNYKAAYSLFKQEIANAVQALPFKKGFDVLSQKHIDVMGPAKNFLSDMRADEADLIESMRKAFNIFWTVFGPGYYSQARNFANFFEIVKDEFMRYRETLPTMGDDDEADAADNPYVKDISNEIDRYMEIERNANAA